MPLWGWITLAMLLPLQGASSSGPWKQLFNGKNLDGWEHVGPGRFYVEDGLMKTEGGMGLLWFTREKFGNCTIKVVYRTTKADDNSGVFVRIPEPPEDPWQAVNSGYEVQILKFLPKNKERTEHQKKHGENWHTTGAIYSMSPARASPQKPPGEWNTMEIHLSGPRIVVVVNGVEVTDFDPDRDPIPPRQRGYEPIRGPRPEEGYIGLQNHHQPQTVYFREIAVRARSEPGS